MGLIGAIFSCTYMSHKADECVANLTSQLCGDLQTTIYVLVQEREPFEDHLRLFGVWQM